MCVFNLDLSTVSEQLLVTSMAREFQMVGAVQRKARSAKRVLVVGLYSSGTVQSHMQYIPTETFTANKLNVPKLKMRGHQN